MKLQVSLSATGYKKGDRVAVRVDKNEWYLGTVVRSGKRLNVNFDDDHDAEIESDDLKDVKLIDSTTKARKKFLTDAQAAKLFTKEKIVVPVRQVKTKIPAKIKESEGNSFEKRMRKVFQELSPKDQHWFRFELPEALDNWFHGHYDGKRRSSNPALGEVYESQSISLQPLDVLIKMLWNIRRAYGPISVPKLYRLTSFKNTGDSKLVKISSKTSLKPVTSWSTSRNVSIDGRESDRYDYLLMLENLPSKYVLTSTEILTELLKIVQNASDFFSLAESANSKYVKDRRTEFMDAERNWNRLDEVLRYFKREQEYIIYLNKGDTIAAKVVKKFA